MTRTDTRRTERQTLRAQAREFAGDVLAHVREVTDPLPTPTERYRATRPFYRQMVDAGFLRRLVPQALGGDGTGASTTAVLAEERARTSSATSATGSSSTTSAAGSSSTTSATGSSTSAGASVATLASTSGASSAAAGASSSESSRAVPSSVAGSASS
ncbi:MAG TPA: acyl-CoA dehydrogenase family protein, partial [Actinomycetospora sp.]|uniref:acyl-CoA dehydrogenase family protein n=1 Tax=Actinomycetospora sp. TaxID=1872135 RepID=UPI002F413B13